MRISDWSSDVCSSDLFARVSRGSSSRGNNSATISFSLPKPTPLSSTYVHRPMNVRRVRIGSAAIVSLVQNSGLIVRMRAMSGPLLNLHFDAPRPTPLLIAPRQPPIAVIDADLVGDAITNEIGRAHV